MGGMRKRAIVLFVLAATVLLCGGLARAELTERGDLFVRFSGGISPQTLPRTVRAPITVHIKGVVRTLSGERPPGLRKISIAINRGGRIDTEGLPSCPKDRIATVTTAEALRACRAALVGSGWYSAAVSLAEQTTFPLHGRVLAFNSVVGGKKMILAQVYGASPLPNSRIVTFHIRQSKGRFGTVLTAHLPARLNPYGYLKKIELSLHRNFVYKGRPHSYLSAACSAPRGLSGGLFPFAHVSMAFADGRTLASTLIRSCHVRR